MRIFAWRGSLPLLLLLFIVWVLTRILETVHCLYWSIRDEEGGYVIRCIFQLAGWTLLLAGGITAVIGYFVWLGRW